MWIEYGRVFDALSADPAVRAIVLSAAGDRAFTAGLDLMSADALTKDATLDPARTAHGLRRHIKEFQDSIGAVERCEKPVIAVVHGIAFGLAIDIATCADVRICSADVKFSVKEVDIGTVSAFPVYSSVGLGR